MTQRKGRYTCTNCHEHIEQSWNFCPYCGEMLDRVDVTYSCAFGSRWTETISNPHNINEEIARMKRGRGRGK